MLLSWCLCHKQLFLAASILVYPFNLVLCFLSTSSASCPSLQEEPCTPVTLHPAGLAVLSYNIHSNCRMSGGMNCTVRNKVIIRYVILLMLNDHIICSNYFIICHIVAPYLVCSWYIIRCVIIQDQFCCWMQHFVCVIFYWNKSVSKRNCSNGDPISPFHR